MLASQLISGGISEIVAAYLIKGIKMEVDDHVVIIGASHAAVQLMISLRQQGWLGACPMPLIKLKWWPPIC